MTDPGEPLLLVTVGTDHHPFDRLIRWADAWLAAEGGDIHLAETQADLDRLLDRVAAEPAAFRSGAEDRVTASAVREFGRLVDGLLGGRPTPRAGAR